MANDVFNIKTDLSIEYFNTSLSAWVEIVADSFEVDIDRGIDVENGVFVQGSIGTATVKLVKKNLSDFLGTPGFKAGDRFNVSYRNLPDSQPTYYVNLFGGYIQNISMIYINESQTLEITIVANDIMRWALNANLPTYSVAGTTVQRSFRNVMTSLFGAISTAASAIGGVTLFAGGSGGSSTVQRAFTWINTAGGEILSRFMNAELGWIWSEKDDANRVGYLTRADIATLKAVAYNPANATVSNVHYTDLVTNGTFEVNTTGWSPGTSVTLTRDTSTFYAGIASLRVNSTATTSTAYTFQSNTTMTAVANSKYKASMWVKAQTNTPTARVQIAYMNSGGTTIQLDSGPFTALNTTGWTKIDVTSVAPTGTVRAEVRVQANKTSAAVASYFADNIKLQNLTTISNNHYCLDNLLLKYDSDLLVNKAKVTEIGSATSAVASNATSIAANGQQANSYSVEYDVANSSTTLAQLATRIADSATIKQVQQVTVPIVRDDGRTSDIAGQEIGNTLQVEFAQDPLPPLQVVSIISRINHVITPQHWEMNINLWRGI